MLYGALNAAEVPTPLANPLEILPAIVETRGAAGTHENSDAVVVSDGLDDELKVALGEIVPLAVLLCITDDDAEEDMDCVTDGDVVIGAATEVLALSDGVDATEAVPVTDTDGATEDDGDAEALVLIDTDGERDGVGVVVALVDGVTDGDTVADGGQSAFMSDAI